MFEAHLRFPVTCPECGKEVLSTLPIHVAQEAICGGRSLTLRSPCHACEWPATAGEIEQIREYLDVACADEEVSAE